MGVLLSMFSYQDQAGNENQDCQQQKTIQDIRQSKTRLSLNENMQKPSLNRKYSLKIDDLKQFQNTVQVENFNNIHKVFVNLGKKNFQFQEYDQACAKQLAEKLVVFNYITILHLDLEWNPIGELGSQWISTSIAQLNSLTKLILNLKSTNLGPNGVKLLINSFNLHPLSNLYLDLSWCNLTSEGIEHLAEGLGKLKSLQKLDLFLQDNKIEDKAGIKLIGVIFNDLSKLQYLNLKLQWNQLSNKSIAYLITQIYIQQNRYTDSDQYHNFSENSQKIEKDIIQKQIQNQQDMIHLIQQKTSMQQSISQLFTIENSSVQDSLMDFSHKDISHHQLIIDKNTQQAMKYNFVHKIMRVGQNNLIEIKVELDQIGELNRILSKIIKIFNRRKQKLEYFYFIYKNLFDNLQTCQSSREVKNLKNKSKLHLQQQVFSNKLMAKDILNEIF